MTILIMLGSVNKLHLAWGFILKINELLAGGLRPTRNQILEGKPQCQPSLGQTWEVLLKQSYHILTVTIKRSKEMVPGL